MNMIDGFGPLALRQVRMYALASFSVPGIYMGVDGREYRGRWMAQLLAAVPLIIVAGAACVKHSCSQNVEGFNHERMRSLQVGQELSTAAHSSWWVSVRTTRCNYANRRVVLPAMSAQPQN